MDSTVTNPEVPLGSLLAETLRKADLADPAIDLAEVAVDQALAGGVVRDLPVLGTLFGSLRAVGAVRDYLLLRKILRFLRPLVSVDPKQRARMVARLQADPEFVGHVGEQLLLLLDRLDSLEKPLLLGRAFRAYLEEKVDAVTLQRLWYSIDRVLTRDLRFLSAFAADPDHAEVSEATRQSFINAGLAHLPVQLLNLHVWPIKAVCEPFVRYVLPDEWRAA